MEWLNDGQRVQKYSIDIWRPAGSRRRRQAIGHKKIDFFPTVKAAKVRLNILSSTDAAQIREFATLQLHRQTTLRMPPVPCLWGPGISVIQRM